MSRQCELCSKLDKKHIARSHSHQAIITRQKVNLQMKKVDGKRMRICTRCVKSMLKKLSFPKIKKEQTLNLPLAR